MGPLVRTIFSGIAMEVFTAADSVFVIGLSVIPTLVAPQRAVTWKSADTQKLH